MKTLLLIGALFAAIPNVRSQYQIDWFTHDGGGGASAGGAYTLAGTAGQPDTGASTGGAYTLDGGFWSAFTATTEIAPALRIQRTGTTVTLAWPNPSTGFQLEETPSLTAPVWTDVNTVPAVVGDEKQVRLPLAPGARFFRVSKP